MSDKAKILVVEDQTPVAMMTVYLLNRAGCEVEAAWDDETALRLAQADDFNLSSLNVDLPGLACLKWNACCQ